MAKIESPGEELIANHTTEEVIAFLAKEGRTLWRRINTSTDPDGEAVRNVANWGTLVGYLDALDKKLNGDKKPTVL